MWYVPLVAVGSATLVLYFIFGGVLALLSLVLFIFVLLKTGWARNRDKIQSQEFGGAVEGSTIPRRGMGYTKLFKQLDDCTTLYELFLHGAKAGEECLGTRVIKSDGTAGPFEWQSYSEIIKRYKNFGSGLLSLGMKQGNKVGIYSENRAEWQITAQTCNAFGFVSVSIYDTLGEEHRQFIIDQAEIVTIVTKRDHLQTVFDLAEECPHLRNIVIYEKVKQSELTAAEDLNLTLHSFAGVEELGQNSPQEVTPPAPDDLAIIMYTSGTTSRPKGVLITHRNVVAVIAGVSNALNPLDKNTRYLSFLPLAHILERAAESYVFYHGGRIGFFQGNMRKFPEDVKELKPTLFAGVPKIYQRIMNTVHARLKKGSLIKRIVFNLAYSLKRTSLYYGFPSSFLDKIFAPVRDALGGQVEQLVTGGAPISPECHEFIRVCFGAPFMQGYGLTETCGGCSVTAPTMINPLGKVGAPVGCCEVKLVDAGKYSTSTNPPQGEVCISGANVTLGYYKNKEKTEAAFKEERNGKIWFHTGDVGQWNDDGTLSIIGRVKDIFKLDTGEYVSPERLETMFSVSKFVGNIFVYGETDKSHLIAVIVPDPIAALAWAEENGISVPDKDTVEPPNCPPSLIKHDALRKAIVDDLATIGTTAKLNRYEFIRNVVLDHTFWMPAGGLVTSALKNKRPVLGEHYGKQLATTYAAGFL